MQLNVKKRHWNQRKNSYVLKFVWEFRSTFSKVKEVNQSLRGPLPPWRLQAGCAGRCAKGAKAALPAAVGGLSET